MHFHQLHRPPIEAGIVIHPIVHRTTEAVCMIPIIRSHQNFHYRQHHRMIQGAIANHLIIHLKVIIFELCVIIFLPCSSFSSLILK